MQHDIVYTIQWTEAEHDLELHVAPTKDTGELLRVF